VCWVEGVCDKSRDKVQMMVYAYIIETAECKREDGGFRKNIFCAGFWFSSLSAILIVGFIKYHSL
jgi:hypothetical protein